jgi:ABC-type polysaccharide/polyol phosphate transport system ATPase subunit
MSNQQDIAVSLQDVEFSFLIQRHGVTSLKELLHRIGKRGLFEKKPVLRKISLDIARGECMGILGKNGSGKSTLLRIISGIILPDKGKVRIAGTVAPILSLGVGLEPELSGSENIRLCCTLLGIPRQEHAESTERIVEFAELSRQDLELQVKRFSTGMMARLAFAIAVARDPDVLIIDEVLAVGDFGFQEKCYRRIDEIKASGSTIVFVSHMKGDIFRICDRAALLQNGTLIATGGVQEISEKYEDSFH